MAFSATHTQQKLLGIIAQSIAETGCAPTYRTMMVLMGQQSTNNIHRMVLRLEERGLVRRLKNRARALEVVAPTREEYWIWDTEAKTLVPLKRNA